MMDEKRLIYYLTKYAGSLQNVVYRRTGNYFHDGQRKPVDFVYLCPICLANKIAIVNEWIHYEEEFTLDHFPPQSVGGQNTTFVCGSCNSRAGSEFDYALKEWLEAQSFINGTKNAEVPIKVALEGVKGKFKGKLIFDGPGSFKYEKLEQYPPANKWFEHVISGNIAKQTISFTMPKMEYVNRALLKAAYLFCFSHWGYDFVYTVAGNNIRKILLGSQEHVLSNFGVFIHMGSHPASGLCYIFKPENLQTFMINFKLTDKKTGFQCSASVLIPGPNEADWQQLKAFQPLIDAHGEFTGAYIKLPEEEFSGKNMYPYTSLWEKRKTFRIAGE